MSDDKNNYFLAVSCFTLISAHHCPELKNFIKMSSGTTEMSALLVPVADSLKAIQKGTCKSQFTQTITPYLIDGGFKKKKTEESCVLKIDALLE